MIIKNINIRTDPCLMVGEVFAMGLLIIWCLRGGKFLRTNIEKKIFILNIMNMCFITIKFLLFFFIVGAY